MDNHGYLLLVEDDPDVQANNKKALTRRSHRIRQAYTLAEARAILSEETPRAVILDIILPDGSGLDFLHELRETTHVPVLLLTALGTPDDILRGLEAGGDRYIPKPYDLDLFLAEVEALLRRASVIPDTLIVGPLKLEAISDTAYLNGADMLLSQKEFSLLLLFTQHQGKIISPEYIYTKVWGQPMSGDSNALMVTVSNLRSSLDGSGFAITGKRGKGYIFDKIDQKDEASCAES
jgi:DNA-binding response OmpR family regulator